MIINEYILYIEQIKGEKIQLVDEDRKKWYGDRLHLIHDAPPLSEYVIVLLCIEWYFWVLKSTSEYSGGASEYLMVLLCIRRYFYELVGTSENSDDTAEFHRA